MRWQRLRVLVSAVLAACFALGAATPGVSHGCDASGDASLPATHQGAGHAHQPAPSGHDSQHATCDCVGTACCASLPVLPSGPAPHRVVESAAVPAHRPVPTTLARDLARGHFLPFSHAPPRLSLL